MKTERDRRISVSRKPGLPRWALVSLYLGLAVLPLFLAATGNVPPASPFAEGAAAAGMVGMVMMVAQLGSSGRSPLLSGRIGIDVTMAFHKWAAPAALALLVAHPILLAGPFDVSAPSRILARLGNLLVAPRLMTGLLALVLFLLITLTAVLRDRLPAGYGLWRLSHGVLALVALIFCLEHMLAQGTYAADQRLRLFWLVLTLGAILISLLRHLIVWRRAPWRVADITRAADRLWILQLENRRDLSFRAGQFVWLRFGRSLSDHPFSIASAPCEKRLNFLIQEAGDFTSQIGTVPVESHVAIDGPHGSFTLDGLPKSDTLILISGGVGLAPILSILSDLGHGSEYRWIRLVHTTRSQSALIAPEFLKAACPSAEITILADDATAGDAPVGRGPLTPEHLRTLLAGVDPFAVNVLICGPSGMMTFATDALHEMGVPLDRIRYERFSYGSGPVSVKDRRILIGFVGLCAAVMAFAFGFTLR
ncbi:ferredoxin reductase family protein [Neorhizobium sp. LjRoot104]|uniref:ferredoxin reductase family protein n=1 Tax=Neorhizobium sp. LjRoot104 TaxID=3342254 RepID=UPI003ECC2031